VNGGVLRVLGEESGFYNISPGTFGYEAVDSATGWVTFTGDVAVEAGKISYATVDPR